METIDRKFRILAVNPANGHIYTDKDALLLCAKDAAVPAALRCYLAECAKLGANPEHLQSVSLLLQRVEAYQLVVDARIPDTVGQAELDRCLRGIGV